MSSRTRRVAFAASFVVLATLFPAAVAGSPGGPPVSTAPCDVRPNDTFSRLLDCVTVEGVREHQAALQEIADDNDGTRVSGSTGYDKSVDYAVDVLEAAGYTVTRQLFDFVRFEVITPAILQQVEPGPITDLPNIIMSYSGNGDVTGAVSTPSGDNRGCTAADWAGFPAGNIALIQRGTPTGQPPCTFGIKATNAFNAGAIGVVIYNNIAGDLAGTLGNTFTLDIPVTGITQGPWRQQLAATPGLVLRLKTEALREPATAENVIAETRSGTSNNVVMAGAHLDSVSAGPGINDNGSGSASILEIAEQMSRVNTKNKLRFALWGAEEANLVGSTFYVGSLSEAELGKIALYLNFDMVGSPNHVFFIYDGDDSDAEGRRPGTGGFGADRRDVRALLRVARRSRSRARTSRAAPTTVRSSPTTSRPVDCSPAPKGSRRPRRRRSGVAPLAWPMTIATTRRATPSPTTTWMRLRRTPTRSRTRHSSTQ